MKIVLVLLAVLAAVWLLRGVGRRRDSSADKPAPPPPPSRKAPDAMVACAHCGVHLPRTEALTAPGGAVFCSEPHRAAAERDHTR